VIRKDNWEEAFEAFFTNSEKGFLNKTELELSFKYLSEIRNALAHGKTPNADTRQCDIYMEKFDDLLPALSSEEEILNGE
jgi:hypothetical protein